MSGDELYSVAQQVADLGGASAVERNDEILGMIDEEQMGIVVEAIPSSRRLREQSRKKT